MLTLSLDDIVSKGNVRVETGDVSTLAASIDRYGVLQPPLVRELADEKGKYAVIDGHRRVAAMRIIGFHASQFVVDNAEWTHDGVIAAQYTANTERKGLSLIHI